jgi:hypothetical protein
VATALEAHPSTPTVQKVAETIRNAIDTGWQQRQATEESTAKSGTYRHHQPESDGLGSFCRWSHWGQTWDPRAIAARDEERIAVRHWEAVTQLGGFCAALQSELEARFPACGQRA